MRSWVRYWNARCEPRSAGTPPNARICPSPTKSSRGTVLVCAGCSHCVQSLPVQSPRWCQAGASTTTTATVPAAGAATRTLPRSSASSLPACSTKTLKSSSPSATVLPLLPRKGTARERHSCALPGASRGAWRSTAHRPTPRLSFLLMRAPMRRWLLTSRTRSSGAGALRGGCLLPLGPPSTAPTRRMTATYGNMCGRSASGLYDDANPNGGSLSSGTSVAGAPCGRTHTMSVESASLSAPAGSVPWSGLGHRSQTVWMGSAPHRITHFSMVSACLRPESWTRLPASS
mmetsp:Transcript_37681/g.106465  ORF Transcript_37681/g.106465 Transcript_37681/m.106465 type:complete len:288 (+) Transcript_37681:764-1627(+)